MKERKAIIKFIFLILILVLTTTLFWKPFIIIFSDAEKIRQIISSFGIFAPLTFILLTILQILFAPLPGQLSGVVGGYLFGALLGLIYSMIALTVGSFIAFYLGRKLGRPFVEKVVSKKTLNKFDKTTKRKGLAILFLIYLLPGLPDDLICYVAGLTNIRIRKLVIISAIGRFPGFVILSLIGAGLASSNSVFAITLFIIMMIFSIIIYLNREKIENSIDKVIKKWSK